MVMLNPNRVVRDRNTPKGRYPITIKFIGGSHLITFTCPECGYCYDAVFHKGMTLHTENLKCPRSKCRAQMNYHIDT